MSNNLEIKLSRLERELLKIKNEYQNFISNIPGGLFCYSFEKINRLNYISDGLLQLLEGTYEELYKVCADKLEEMIYYEDRDMVLQNFHKKTEDYIKMEHRIKTLTGKIKWVQTTVHKVYEDTVFQYAMVVIVDITDLKKALLALRKEETKYHLLTDWKQSVIFEYNIPEDRWDFNNKAFLNVTTYDMISFINTLRDSESILEEDKDKVIKFFSSINSELIEFRCVTREGELLWCSAKSRLVYNDFGALETIIGIIKDITEQKRETEKLLLQVKRDSLTQLYNKRYTQAEIEEILNESIESDIHAFIIIDVDNFKAINDNLGHLFGDMVLTNISSDLKKAYDSGNIVGRVGGDEFIVFLHNIKSILEAKKQAREIIKIFNNLKIDEVHNFSCSVGISMYPQDGNTYIELYKYADIALYQAKVKGKNRYEFYMNCNAKNDLSAYRFINFDREITAYAFDLMANSSDINEAIQTILIEVGKILQVSRVCVLENEKETNSLVKSYTWTNYEEINEMNIPKRYYYESFPSLFSRFDEHGIIYVANVNEVSEEERNYLSLIEGGNIQSILQCGFFENGDFMGCISVGCYYEQRNWTQYEVDSLVSITKVISSYLLKMRASERLQLQLDYIKNYDDLTGLPLSCKFKKEARKILKDNILKQYAIVYLDISNFKYYNEVYGYVEGDKLLCDFANQIKGLPFQECICRISSDNFMCLVSYDNIETLRAYMIEISEDFTKKQKENHINCNVIVASGISVVHSTDKDIMVAVESANVARKIAKKSSISTCQIYNEEMHLNILKEMEILNTMEQALQEDEFKLFLQPKVKLSDNSFVGAEALVRWIKPGDIIYHPRDFISIFEKNGFVLQMDFYIYEKVCCLLRKWLDNNMPCVPISVNVSRIHLNDPEFVAKFKQLVNKYKIPVQYIEVELTESIFLDNTKKALSVLNELRNEGFLVSIDDFGAGYSSLNLLKDMCTDVLKLDKEFFCQGDMKEDEKIIVSSIIKMAKQLNMKVLSEGVETQMQSDFLKEVSCDMAQGYLYAKPMDVEHFEMLLKLK